MYRIHWRLGWLTSNGMMPCACVSQNTHHTQSRERKKGILLHKTSVLAHTKIIIFRKNIEKERKVSMTTTTTTTTSRSLEGRYSISLLLYYGRIVRCENVCILVFAAFIFGCDQFLLDFPVLSQINVCTLKFPYLVADSPIYNRTSTVCLWITIHDGIKNWQNLCHLSFFFRLSENLLLDVMFKEKKHAVANEEKKKIPKESIEPFNYLKVEC